MKAIFLSAALLSATVLTTAPSIARDGDRSPFVVTPNQVIDIADARIAQLKADLRLNTDQDRNWGSFQSAMHDMAQRRADRMKQMQDQRSTSTDATTQPPAPADRDRARDDRNVRDDRNARTPDLAVDLRRQADAMTAKADDYRKFADASGPLYGSLDDTQRGRFLMFVQNNLLDDNNGSDERGGRGRRR